MSSLCQRKIWILFLFLSACSNFIALRFFIEFYDGVKRNCFLFCHIDIYRRTLTNQSTACVLVLLFMVLSFLLRVINIGLAFKTHTKWSLRFINYGVVMLDVAVCLLILLGVYQTCSFAFSYGGLDSCTREVFTFVDFYTFKPKYMRGFAFPHPFYETVAATIGSFSLSLLSKYLHWKCDNTNNQSMALF